MSDFFEDFGGTEIPAGSETGGSRSKRKRSPGRAFALGFVLATVLAVGIAFFPSSESSRDFEGTGTGSVTVTIPEGATGTDIARILAENGVVKTDKAFIEEFSADARAASIQPGTYSLKKEMSASAALSALLNPTSKEEMKVTIPEGFTKQQVFERLASVLGVSVEEVRAAASDPNAIGLPAEAGGDLEGWFAPLTYTLEPGMTAEQALAAMVSERVIELQQIGVPQAQWKELLTKASIIEREANRAEDYPKVARVIENRLVDVDNVNGRLQMDSTVLYGLGRTGGVPTQAELDQDTPYNTYKNQGLPPGPIGNPGEAAIKAALQPADGSWLYFVTVDLNTGETRFATTLEEHEANIQAFAEWSAAHPEALQ